MEDIKGWIFLTTAIAAGILVAVSAFCIWLKVDHWILGVG